MQEYTIIFIGKSGSGKGTQIKLLSDFLQSRGNSDMYYLQSGQGLRELSSQESYSGGLLNSALMEGKLVPTSVAIWSWVNGIIKNFTGQKIFFVDGAPRKLNEAMIMDEMFDFYERKNRIVLTIDVSDEWSKDKLKNRGRKDDTTEESVISRLNWFNENSPEILSFFEKTGKYRMCTINGEQSIEEVQKDIISALQI
jgi:UMP-CMP kinase